MNDSLSDVDPDVFTGGFHMSTITTLVVYSPYSKVRLGGAVGDASGLGLSTDLISAAGISGYGWTIRKRVEDCCQ